MIKDNVKILAIDDNGDNLIVVGALLSEYFPQSTIFTADSGQKGISLANLHKPDIILLDLLMPVMDGFEVCRALKSDDNLKHIPIIILTAAREGKEKRVKAIEWGADAFITKPIDETEFSTQVNAMLRIKISEDLIRNENDRLAKLVDEKTYKLQQELEAKTKIATELKHSLTQLEKSKQAAINIMEGLKEEMAEKMFAREELNRIFNLVPDLICITNCEGYFKKVNPHWETILGYQPKELQYKQMLDFVHPMDRLSTRATLEKQKNGDEIVSITNRYLCKDKKYKWLEWVICPSPDGELLYAAARDISMHIDLKQSLEKSEYFFRESQRAAMIGSYHADFTKDAWESSEVLDAILGIDKSFERSVVGWLNIIHPEDRKMMSDYLKVVVLGEGLRFDKEYRIVRIIDGECRWVHGMGEVARNKLGVVVSLIGTIQDITERKLVENELIKSNLFNEAILRTIPFGMDLVDETGTVIFMSESLRKKIDQIDIQGKKCWELYHDDKKQSPDCPLLKGIEIGRTDYYETSRVFSNRVFQISHTGMLFDGKKALLEIFEDITEKKLAKQNVLELNKKYKILVETTEEIIFTVNTEWQFVWVNNAFRKHLGFIFDDVSKLTLNELVVGKDLSDMEHCYISLSNNEQVKNINCSFISKEGNIIDVLGTLSPIIEGDLLIGIQGFFRNVTEINKERFEREKAESRLKKTLDEVGIGLRIYDFEWKYLYINNVAASPGGKKPEDFVNKSIFEMSPNIKAKNIFKQIEEAMLKRTPMEFVDKHSFVNGTERWFEINVEPIEEGILVLSKDITEAKQNEQEQIKNKKLLKDAELTGELGSWEYEIQTGEIFLSEGIFNILEIDLLDFMPLPENVLALIHPDDLEFVKETYLDSIHKKSSFFMEHRIVIRTGEIKFVQQYGETIFNEQGKPVRSIGTVQNVTKQRESEKLLKATESKFQQVVEHINDALVVDDIYGNITFYNERFLELFKLKEEESGNLVFEDIIAPEYRKEARERHNKRIAGENMEEVFEIEGICKDGTRKWLEIRVCKIFESGVIVGTQSAIRDVSERIIARQVLETQNKELKKINQELDRFVYSTSHDLRSPLLSISGLIDLCTEATERDEILSYFDMMRSSINRLDGTIKEIMEYSRNSRMELILNKLDMHSMVKGVIDSLTYAHFGRNIQFIVHIDEEIPFTSDKIRVNTIINNLVSNAVKYQRADEKKPYVKISFHSTAEKGIISVEDNGEGISEKSLNKVFEMFYRGSVNSDGSGLGLYICKEIVNKLGGEINIESKWGSGSMFTIQIPNHISFVGTIDKAVQYSSHGL